MIRLFNTDNLQFMRSVPDKFYELAIVDPPYGIGEDGGKCRTRGSKKTNGVQKNWDNERPSLEYFNELMRISVNQIIFGGNYFADMLAPSRCWIYWRKVMGGDFADGELAWTSFDRVVKEFTKRSETFNRIHPTSKPTELYKWLLKNYAKEGDKIFDSHGGSLSIAIACGEMGYDLDACELDGDYFKDSVARVQRHFTQSNAFMKTPEILVSPKFG